MSATALKALSWSSVGNEDDFWRTADFEGDIWSDAVDNEDDFCRTAVGNEDDFCRTADCCLQAASSDLAWKDCKQIVGLLELSACWPILVSSPGLSCSSKLSTPSIIFKSTPRFCSKVSRWKFLLSRSTLRWERSWFLSSTSWTLWCRVLNSSKSSADLNKNIIV